MCAETEVLLLANAQGKSRRWGNHASICCPHLYSHPQKTPPAFVILKLLVKPLLSRVPTALSVLVLPFLPRKKGFRVDRSSLLPSRSQGGQTVTLPAFPPAVGKASAQHGAPHWWQVPAPQQHTAVMAVDEGQLHLPQDRTQHPSRRGSSKATSSICKTAHPSGRMIANSPIAWEPHPPLPHHKWLGVPHHLPAWF